MNLVYTAKCFLRRSLNVPALMLILLAGCTSVAAPSGKTYLNSDQPTVLITGANRGIGLAFAKYYAAAGWNVIATARQPDAAAELTALATSGSVVVAEQLDVTDLERIKELAAQYADTPIDLLINNAAVLGDLDGQMVGSFDYEQFQWSMAVNTYAPLAMAEAFKPSIAASEQKKIVTLSSGLGSLTRMSKMEGMTYYRASKSAMNMSMRAIRASYRKDGIIVALIAPGLVGTQLLADSGYRGKSLTPEESVAGMAEIIASLTLDDAGTPTNVDGRTLPW